MQPMRVPAGSHVFLGAPAEPMEPEIVTAIGRLVDGVPEIIEAHLPQVFVSGSMQAPAQVLVVVTVERDVQRALDKLGAGLGRILPSGRSIDVWPLSPTDKLLPTFGGRVVASVNALGRPGSSGACAASSRGDGASSRASLRRH